MAGSTAFACGWDGNDCEIEACSSFFIPEVAGNPAESPFYRSLHKFYKFTYNSAPDFEKVNLAEWTSYFGKRLLSAKSLKFMVYGLSLEELDRVIFALKGKKSELAKEAKELLAEINRLDRKDFPTSALYYLGFAKRVEPFAMFPGGGSWEQSKPRSDADRAALAKLIQDGGRALLNQKDPFLAARYRFQILRLYFYSGQFSEAVKFYDENSALFEQGGESIKWRAMDLTAGALTRTKDLGRANYLSSLIFANYPALKVSAYLSFRPYDESDWKASLAMSKNSLEKEYLYQMMGLFGNGVDAIQKIYELNPKSRLLDLLLVREINIAEEIMKDLGSKPKAFDKVISWLKPIADKAETARPELWYLALSHLYAINGQAKESLSYLDQLDKVMKRSKRTSQDRKLISTQVRMNKFYIAVSSGVLDNKQMEDSLASDLDWLRSLNDERAGNLLAWGIKSVRAAYEKQSGSHWALMLSGKSDDAAYLDNSIIDKIIALQTKKNRTKLEDFAVKFHNLTVEELHEVQGINHLYEGDFKQAAKKFQKVREARLLEADPFVIHNQDCHECDRADGTKLDKKTFALKMAELKTKAGGTGEASAQASFLLANGLYNMSYFGNGRAIFAPQGVYFSNKISRHRNMSEPEKYYLRAAELSKDQEFKARSIFMAAKAEHNRHYDATLRDEYGYFSGDKVYYTGKNFATLKESYGNTKYFQEILNECGFFSRYVTGVDSTLE